MEINTSPNLVLSDSEIPPKFQFCMQKNTTQADFQLNFSTPGILAAIRSPGETVMKLQHCCEWISKIPLHGWWPWKNWSFVLTKSFGSVYFLTYFSDLMDQKMAGAKKVVILKNLSTMQRNFWNQLKTVLQFHNLYPKASIGRQYSRSWNFLLKISLWSPFLHAELKFWWYLWI